MKEVKVTLISRDNNSSTLGFVKLVKEQSGLGLKEAKEWCDSFTGRNAWYNSQNYKKNRIHLNDPKAFKEECAGLGYNVDIDDKYEKRKRMFFELGMCSEDEVLDNLSELLTPIYDLNKVSRTLGEYTADEARDELENINKEYLKNKLSKLSPEILNEMNLILLK